MTPPVREQKDPRPQYRDGRGQVSPSFDGQWNGMDSHGGLEVTIRQTQCPNLNPVSKEIISDSVEL